jgi:hypothetical protein
VVQHINTGKLRALAVMARKRRDDQIAMKCRQCAPRLGHGISLRMP